MPIRTLHIDIEGGWGGSSRSLFELTSKFHPNQIYPVIAHRQKGPISKRYKKIGIQSHHMPEIFSYAPKLRVKNFKNFIASIPKMLELPKIINKIINMVKLYKIQIIHLNYEGLFIMAKLLKEKLNVPIICHSRTQIPNDIFGRYLVKTLSKNVDHIFFISPQEKKRFCRIEMGSKVSKSIMWNISAKKNGGRLKRTSEVVYFGDISPDKGTDRLIDIAKELESEKEITIAVYGTERSKKGFLEHLIAKSKSQGIQNKIIFRKHNPEPEKIMRQSLALVRPSRYNDPWGRDVIEATCNGLPVLATGNFSGVIKSKTNGFLFNAFNAKKIAQKIIELHNNQKLWNKLSKAGLKIGKKFSGQSQVKHFYETSKGLIKK